MDLATPDNRPPRGAGSTGGGGSARLDPEELCRFEGEGGPAVPEPVALEPPESI